MYTRLSRCGQVQRGDIYLMMTTMSLVSKRIQMVSSILHDFRVTPSARWGDGSWAGGREMPVVGWEGLALLFSV